MNSKYRNTTRLVAISAVMTALSIIFIYLGSVFPTGQLGFAAASSLFVIAAVIECGVKGGVFVFVGASMLSLLLVPEKSAALLFILFFGYYPVVKSFSERPKSRIVEWIIKLILLNVSLSAIIFLFSVTVFDVSSIADSKLLIYLISNIAFVLYDIGISRLIYLYINNISKRIKH